MASETEKAMVGIISAFVKYAGKKGNPFTLSKGDLIDLLKNEMRGIFENDENHSMKSIYDLSDLNMDGSIDFSEYMRLIVSVIALCYDMLIKRAEFSSQ